MMRSRSTTMIVTLCVAALLAAPVVLAGPRAEAGTAQPAGTLALPQVQPPPLVRSPGTGVIGIAPPVEPSPLLDPDVARLRLKDFVSKVYSQSPAGSPGSSTRPPLETVLQQIDGLPADQVQALDARLGPLIWTTRALGAEPTHGAPGAVPNEDTDTEALRQELDAYFARLEPYAPIAKTPAYADLLTRLRHQVQTMPQADLQQVLDIYNQMPTARQALLFDPATIIGGPPPGGGSGTSSAAGGPAGRHGALPNAGSIHTDSACADMAFGPTATAVLVATSQAANDTIAFVSDDFMSPAGEPAFNFANPARLILASIALVLNEVALAASADLTYFINCNEGAHQVLMVEHGDEQDNRMGAIQGLLDDPTKTADLKRILANRMDRFEVFNADFRALTLRLAIEKDLLRQGDPRISMLQIPNDICVTVDEHQNCGQLNTVHDIVADTILMNRALGYDTTLASVALNDGDAQLALGNYKPAYTRYRYAYQLAVRSR